MPFLNRPHAPSAIHYWLILISLSRPISPARSGSLNLQIVGRHWGGKRDEKWCADTRRRGRASAHREAADGWGLRGIRKAFRDESPSNLSRVQSLNDSNWRMTIGTQASGAGGS